MKCTLKSSMVGMTLKSMLCYVLCEELFSETFSYWRGQINRCHGICFNLFYLLSEWTLILIDFQFETCINVLQWSHWEYILYGTCIPCLSSKANKWGTPLDEAAKTEAFSHQNRQILIGKPGCIYFPFAHMGLAHFRSELYDTIYLYLHMVPHSFNLNRVCNLIKIRSLIRSRCVILIRLPGLDPAPL